MRGSSEIGEVADVQILDQDIFLVKSENTVETNILVTIVGRLFMKKNREKDV